MYNGILIVDKPEDFTSHDVIAKLRGILKMRKMGHSGTLDPMATGILPIFLGTATRAVDYHANTKKEYIAKFKLGIKTDTEDIWGDIKDTCPVNVTKEQVYQAINQFQGKISQIPPMYSAIKINGQKLYDIARNGGTVERKPREIEIFEIEILNDETLDKDEYKIRILCSKGTYIRTLCVDIGSSLGVFATLTELRRSKSGDYSKGLTLDEIQKLAYNNDIEKFISPTDSVFSEYLRVDCNETAWVRLKNGTFGRDCDMLNMPNENNLSVAVYYENNFFMIGETRPLYDGGRAIFPIKSFF